MRMKKGLFSLRALALTVAFATVSAASAQASIGSISWSSLSTTINTSACSQPTFYQPFTAFKDTNLYTLAPGQQAGNFGGIGWILSGGAHIVTTTLANGTQSQALDIPLGGTAVSPPMCVTSDYPTARTMVRELVKGPGLNMSVVYTRNSAWLSPIATGAVQTGGTTWGASGVINIHPGNMIGWQEARFAFVGMGADTQLYDFYVDPRMKL
jgi:hypothetical protein